MICWTRPTGKSEKKKYIFLYYILYRKIESLEVQKAVLATEAENLRVAVVDADGCAVVEQQITGPFHDPEIQKPNVLVAVTGPMLDLVQRGVRAITNRDCDTFYSGSLPHP